MMKLHGRIRCPACLHSMGAMRRCQVYEVPILTEFGITTCNITIREGVEKEKGSIEIAMNSKEFGRLQASFKVKEKKVNGFVTVEDETSVSSCQERHGCI